MALIEKDGSERVLMDRRQPRRQEAAPPGTAAPEASGGGAVPAGRRSAEEDYRRLYDQLPLMVFSLDREGRVLAVNEHGARELGYARGDLTGRSVLGVFHPADREAAARLLRSALDCPDEIWQWELRQVRRDGTTLWVRETVRVIQAAGGEPRILLVCQDDSERRAVARQVADYRNRLRQLDTKLVRAEEDEARRIARLLHDELGQTLAAARLMVCDLRDSTTARAQAVRLEKLGADIDGAIEVTRSLTYQLSPPILHDLGLAAALEALVERTAEDHGLGFDFQLADGWSPPAETTGLVLYRVVRELLHNMAKHARASHVRLALDGAPYAVRLELEDDGVGLGAVAAGTAGRSLGLFHVRERIERLGGRFEIGSVSRSGGTRAVLELPIDR